MDHEQWEQVARDANPISFHENVVCFDVDQTLIIWGKGPEDCDTWMQCDSTGVMEGGVAHKEHVEALKKHKKDGHFVIVWSAGGGQYARNACIGLGITEHVDLCLDKPMQYYDDIDCSKFMGRTTYLGNSIMYGHRDHGPYQVRTDYVGDWSERD